MPHDYEQTSGHAKRRTWKLYIAAIGFSLGMLSIAFIGAYSVWHGQHINEQLCHFADENRQAIVNILIAAETAALEEAKTPAEIDRIQTRTDQYIALVPPIRCTVGGRPVELEITPSLQP